MENFTDVLQEPDEILGENSGFWWTCLKNWVVDNDKVWKYLLGTVYYSRYRCYYKEVGLMLSAILAILKFVAVLGVFALFLAFFVKYALPLLVYALPVHCWLSCSASRLGLPLLLFFFRLALLCWRLIVRII